MSTPVTLQVTFPNSIVSSTAVFTSPPPIGSVTPNTGVFSTLQTNGTFTVSGSGAVNLGSGTTTVGGNLAVTGNSTLTGDASARSVTVSGASSLGLSANTLRMENNGGFPRLLTVGANNSTAGTFSVDYASLNASVLGTTATFSSTSLTLGAGIGLSVPGTSTLTGNVTFGGSLLSAGSLVLGTNGSTTALTLDTSQNLIQASGAYHQFGKTYSAGVVAATGTIAVKDTTGTVYNMLVHT